MKHLFIGLNTIDLQFSVEKYPEENTKTKSKQNNVAVGGPSTNAAVACAFSGGKTELVSPVGNHDFNAYIQSDLKRYGVELIDPIADMETEAVFASIINSEENGSRTVYSYFPIKNGSIRAEVENRDADTILFDGFYPYMTKQILEKQNLEKTTVILDGGSWKEGLEELIPYVDIAVCSEHFRPPGTKSFIDVFNFFAEKGISKVAITQGDKPIIMKENGKFSEVAVPKIQAVDTLGAGDFFHGAFCFHYAQTKNFTFSLEKASVLAAKSCESFGTRNWMK